MADGTHAVIVGAGLSGALLACALGRAGWRVDVFERRPDPRRGPVERGRSINLALSTRGIHALAQVGLADAVLAESIEMRGRMIHDRRGRLSFQPYDPYRRNAIRSVSRAGLNRILVEAAERLPGVRVHFGQRCVDVDLDAPAACLCGADGRTQSVRGDLLIGADGAFSAVRARMQRLDRFDYQQAYLGHGYKELTIPPAPGGAFRMEPHALHIWPRRQYMMIALPNTDGSFTCTLFLPFEGPVSFAALDGPRAVADFFRRDFPDAVPLLAGLTDEFFANPTGSLVTIRCGPWHYRDRVVLIGDACHAVVPFYGQGMNAAFEDCTVLMACLAQHADRAAALAAYYAARKPHVDTLADLAIANFLEMRDRTGQRSFRLRKAVEHALARLLPGWYVPLYTLVTFTRTPYRDAVRRARRQDRAAALGGAALLLAGLAAAWRLAR